MPRYFFDIHDGSALARDAYGMECDCKDQIRDEAIRTLHAIVRDEFLRDSDRLTFTVLIRDESDVTVYTATLTLAGFWLGDTPIPEPERDAFD